MTSMAPIRCTGIKQVLLSDDGSTVLLELTMANGKTFPLELEAKGIELLTRALLVSAQAVGGPPRERQPLISTPVSEAIDVPVQALVARAQADGSSALMLRTGCLDLRLALPDAAARNAALEALQQPAP